MDTLLAFFIVLVLQGTGMNPRYANFALATAKLGNIFPLSWLVGAVNWLVMPCVWVTPGHGHILTFSPNFSRWSFPLLTMMTAHAHVAVLPSGGGGPSLVPPLLGIVPKHLLRLFTPPIPHALHVGTGVTARPAHGLVGRLAALIADPVLALAGPQTIVDTLGLLGIARLLPLTLLVLRVSPCTLRVWPVYRLR